MKISKNDKHIMTLNEIELRIIKRSLEYSMINIDEVLPCPRCQKRLFKLLNRLTKKVDGKSLIQKMTEIRREVN